MPMNPFRTAKLSEDQIQALLEYALGEGGPRHRPRDLRQPDGRRRRDHDLRRQRRGRRQDRVGHALGMDTPGVPDGSPGPTSSSSPSTWRTSTRADRHDRRLRADRVPGDPDGRHRPVGAMAWPWTTSSRRTSPFPADPNAFQLGDPDGHRGAGRGARSRAPSRAASRGWSSRGRRTARSTRCPSARCSPTRRHSPGGSQITVGEGPSSPSPHVRSGSAR